MTEDERLRKDAVIAIAKQIFIEIIPNWVATDPTKRMALGSVIQYTLKAAEAFHAEIEKYLADSSIVIEQ